MAIEVMKQIAQFLEDKWDRLDYREAYLNNERTKAVVAILWSFICLQHSYLDSELIYWVKRVYHMLYSHEVPYFLKEWQMLQGIVA